MITTGQLIRCGLSKQSIARRVRSGWLHRKHRGVYAVGRPDLSPAGVFHAAVLAVGEDALPSNRATAAHLGFVPYRGTLDAVEVTVPRRGIRRPGIKVYYAEDIPRACRTIWRGVPTTTAAHAILDLAATIPSDEVFARTLHEAEVQDRVTHDQLKAEIDRHPNHPGAPASSESSAGARARKRAPDRHPSTSRDPGGLSGRSARARPSHPRGGR